MEHFPLKSRLSDESLALDRPRGLGELMGVAWRLWRGQPATFLLTACVVVIPVYVVMTGVVGHGFSDPRGRASGLVANLQLLVMSTLGTALVTATHSRAVVALAAGERVSTARAFRLGAGAFWVVLAAGVVYFLASTVGYALIFFPGAYLSVAGLFAAQIAAIENQGPVAALKSSIALTNANGWWRTLGYWFVLLLVTGVISAIFNGVFSQLSPNVGLHAHNLGYIAVPVLALVNAVAMSWSALVLTLLYFSWRAQTDNPYTRQAPTADERSPTAHQ